MSRTSAAFHQAEQLRQAGNLCFNKHRYGAAIDAYTEAITLCPNVAVYWTNRALCHRRRDDWSKVEFDSRKAIQLDHNSFKAHYMLGLSLLEKKEYSEGIRELEKALELGRDANPNSYMVEEIWQALAKAKYSEWVQKSSKRLQELENLKDCCEIALTEKHLVDASQREGFVDSIETLHAEQLKTLEWVFKKASKDDVPTEVPDYLCCTITLDIFRDPVIAPSGVTYEREIILEHIKKVGKFDPVTREPLSPSQLIPNLAIKKAVQAYLDKHAWAYQMG